MVPFYRLHRRQYAVYWDLFSDDGWNQKLLEHAAAAARERKLADATVSFIQPGDAEKEKAFNQQGEDTNPDRMYGRTSRRGKKWFSFDLPANSSQPLILMVTYHTEERTKRTFEVLVEGQKIAEQTVERHQPGNVLGRFFDVEYQIPAELLTGKQKVTVRFQATGGNEIAAVYGVRLIRGER